MDTSLQEITDRIIDAQRERTTLRIKGGGSKDFYAQSLQGNILSTRDIKGIVSYEPSELVVTVRAGTPLRELDAALAEKGQFLPFEPPHFQRCLHDNITTIGGAVSCGLSGPARASVGSLRDYLLGIRMINGRGEHLTFGGQVIKNVAGYDISRLMSGSMGILGVITEVSLKVLAKATSELTIKCTGLSQSTALDLLHEWGGQPLPLNASYWLIEKRGFHFFIRLRGALAAVQAAAPIMLSDIAKAGGLGDVRDSEQASKDWDACRDQRLPFFTTNKPEHGLWRISVPQTAPVLDLPFDSLIEWHGGLRWTWAPLSAKTEIQQAAHTAGGQASLFIAPSTGCPEEFLRMHPLPENLYSLNQRLKKEFDPFSIFNPSRLYPGL